ncbi:hypothetical protein NBRC110019_10640 [Neptunitalea chrysea]|uniref:LamG-like jellyroll fold domain-containing protein n=2 Tax=Neptunitalea chrysea TaxID=1647581 RepID=A0A9W6ETI4_9FLAO|nr:hypothetical protein NBRC110019_10640 [Neptunitalea chrysea]
MNFGLQAQTTIPGDSLVFGPMFSPVYQNKVRVWMLTKNNTGTGATLTLSMTGASTPTTELTGTVYNSDDRLDYSLRSFEFTNLQVGETYTATLLVDGVSSGRTSTISNEQSIVDDFTFLAGGCARIFDLSRCIDTPESFTHINGDPEIFNHMAAEDSDLMVWLGDAVYLLGLQHADGQCPDGVDDWANKNMAFDRYRFYRQFHDSLLMSMPQLAITDNHDTGPNEFNKTMPTLADTREVFMEWWPNPEYLSTSEGQGLYSSYVYKDVEYFLTDNRSYRDGTAQHFGDEQLEWLKQGLLNSTATFKVIINGTPTFREIGGRNFSVSNQADEFLAWIQDHNINGVFSYCADIHDQRFMVREGDTKYPLYDIMSGNLNSDIGGNGETGSYSVNYQASDDILSGVKHAYAKNSVYGDPGDRRIKIEYVGFDGVTFFEEIIHEQMLTSQNSDALNLSLDFANDVADASVNAHSVQATNYTFGTDHEGTANEALVYSANTTMSAPLANSLTFHDRAYSLSFWVNPASIGSKATILSNGVNGAGVSFGISDNGNLIYTNHATGNTLTSNYTILANDWIYVTYKYDNVRRKLSLYYNGFLIQTWNGVASPIESGADVTIGNDFEGNQFIGSLDDVNLYGRLISDEDILLAANVDSNRGEMLKLAGGQQTNVPSTNVNSLFTNDFTIEFWAKLNADPGTNVPMFSSHGRVNGNSTGISMEFNDSNQLNIVLGTNGSGWNKIDSQGDSWTVGEWNHVAVTATDGGAIKYYLNGAFVAEMTNSGYVPNDYGMGFGYSPYYGSDLAGGMDEFRIWTKALTAEEVAESMHYPLDGSETDLGLYYDFTEYDTTGTTVMSEGSVNYLMDVTTASLTTSTAPVGNIGVTYQDEVLGKWSKVNSVNSYGLSFSDAISIYTSNIVIGKQVNTGMAAVPNLADVYYLEGGWKIDPLNSPFASVRVNLSEALGTSADSIAGIAGQFYLLKKDEGATDFTVVKEGSFDGANVNFYDTNLEESIYYFAWEEADFIPGRGGAISLTDNHEMKIHYTPAEIVLNGTHTFELWLNIPSDPSDKPILSNHGRVNGLSTGFTLELNDNNTLSAVYGNNGSGWTKASTSTSLNMGEWYHVAITANPGNEVKIYLNGVLESSTAFSSYIANNTWEFMFGESENYGGSVNYMMDEFRMWSVVRTQDEIIADMHRMLDVSGETLKYYFAFDQDDTGILVNEGYNTTTDITYADATILDATSPVADLDAAYDNTVTGSWSITSEEINGMYVGENITDYTKNIVFGRNEDNTIAEITSTTDETHYVTGGWYASVMNMTTADISVDLSYVFDNVAMIDATVAQYLLLSGDPSSAYVVEGTATSVNGIVTFNDVAITNGIYYLAYEIDLAAAVAEQGGVLELQDSHDVAIDYTTAETLMAGAHTIELWVNLSEAASGSNKTILANHGRINSLTTGFTLQLESGNALNAIYGNNGSGWTLTGTQGLQLGEWNHIAIVAVPGSDIKVYLNGELESSTSFTSYIPNSTWDFTFGKSLNYGGSINFKADEFRLWTVERTQDEIKADMYKTLTTTEPNLAINYTFNQDDNGTLVDGGSATSNITYTNAAIVPATTPVRVATAPYDDVVAGSWSVKNDTAAGMYYGSTITDFNSNIVVGKETGTTVLPVLGAATIDTLYLNSRFYVDPLFITSGSVHVDLTEIFDDLNQVDLIANDYFLLTGDPATAVNIIATGSKTNNVVTFDNVTFDEEPVYLAWININEYPVGTFPIASGGIWKYNDNGVDLGTSWYDPSYDDNSWLFGNAVLGYGDGIESTTLDYGTDASNKYPTYYLRHTFTVDDASVIGDLVFNVQKDDGVVVYVNGTEAFRLNMPTGVITYDTYASSAIGGSDEEAWIEVETSNLLVTGENVIAVELHQAGATSSDLRFDMSVDYNAPALDVTDYPVSKDEEWYYLDQGTDLGTDWLATDYDVIPWSRGNAPFGYGDTVNTTVSYGSDASNKYITTYYVKDINVTYNDLTDNVEFGLRRDDGAVVYVNGVEVFRSNMPTGTVDYLTTATNAIGGIDENIYFTIEVPKTAFVDGVNRIAVELHQANATSSDTRFDMYLKNTEDLGIDCTTEAIGCFTSINPTSQTTNLIIPQEHTFQMIMKEGDAYMTGGGNMPGNNDFTCYVPINGSSEQGYLSVNQENTPGGVSMLDIHLDTATNLWVVDNSQAVDIYDADLVTTTRNCSGGLTPWGTVVTAEETMNSGDSNGDGYQDVGWLVEIDPATASVIDQDGDGSKDKLWAMGRMNHENVVITADGTTAYYGEDGGTHCVYKYVMDTPGDLSAGTVYVLSLDLALSGSDPSSSTGTWIEVPNDTQSDRNNLNTVASSVGGTTFNGIEDVEINPLNNKIYFTAKGLNRVYRFKDNGDGTFSEFETFVGGMSYDVNTASGAQTEAWANGNDNLTFDDQGNLWVLQDGGKNYIWVVRPDHTQSTPNVELFSSMPIGSEPTGLTFSPDYKYGFFSVQHPSGSNVSQTDAAGNSVTFNASATIVISLENNLGTYGLEEVSGDSNGITLYPNPTEGLVTLQFNGSYSTEGITIEVFDVLGRSLITYNDMSLVNKELSLDLRSLSEGNQVLLLQVTVDGVSQQFKVLMK